jgi:hypothetical protein
VGGCRGITLTSIVGGGAFFSDPYSNYPTRLIDPINGSDVVGGTAFTQSWNGINQSWQTYQTLQYGINDYFINAGVRLGLLVNTSYPVNDANNPITFPNCTIGTLGPTAFRILMGDPSANQAQMATIDGSGITLARKSMLSPGASFTAPYSIFRKIQIQNNVHGGTGIVLVAGCNHSIVEFCHIHDMTNDANDNNAGVYLSGASDGCIIRYNKMHDNRESQASGAPYQGGWCIESYFSTNTVIQNNELYNAGAGIFNKGAPASGSWLITRNVIRDMSNAIVTLNTQGGIYYGEQNASDSGSVGDVISYNLFYNCQGAGMWQVAQDKTAQNTGFLVFNNTVAQDCNGGFTSTNSQTLSFYNNIVIPATGLTIAYKQLGPNSVTFSACDYNFYFGTEKWEYDRFGPSDTTISTFSSGAAGNKWITVHTDHPTFTWLTFDPDGHGAELASFVNGPSDVNFVDPASRNYTLKNSSLLKGAGQGGIDPGYDPSNIGPGW